MLREPWTYEASTDHHWPRGWSTLHLELPMYQQHMIRPSKMPKEQKKKVKQENKVIFM